MKRPTREFDIQSCEGRRVFKINCANILVAECHGSQSDPEVLCKHCYSQRKAHR